MNKQLFNEIQDRYLARIAEKNSWGKNEVKQLWITTVAEVLVEKIQQVLDLFDGKYTQNEIEYQPYPVHTIKKDGVSFIQLSEELLWDLVGYGDKEPKETELYSWLKFVRNIPVEALTFPNDLL